MCRQGAGRDPLRGDRRYRACPVPDDGCGGWTAPRVSAGGDRVPSWVVCLCRVRAQLGRLDRVDTGLWCSTLIQNPRSPSGRKGSGGGVRGGFDGKGTSVPRTDRDPPKGMEMYTWRVAKHSSRKLAP